MAFSSEHGFPQFVARETFMRGSMLAAQGQFEEGLTQLRQSIDTYLAGGTELLRPIFLSGLAAAHGTVGQIDEGLALLTEALVIVDKTGLRLNEVGLYLLKGTLTLQSKVQGPKSKVEESPKSEVRSPESEAEECFWKAIEIARNQQAKSLELQAVMSLCRLWQQQGKKEEARQMLAEIYGWFTEGFDTKDLQEAKALLEELT
jgi:predicted ATPase